MRGFYLTHRLAIVFCGLLTITLAAALSGCPMPVGGGGQTVTIIDGPFSPNRDTSMNGTIEADSINIPTDVTLTASGDLVIRSKGPVTIVGKIEGVMLDDRGASITIESAGPIDVEGEITGGSGPSAAEIITAGNAVGADGADGGSVSLHSASDITMGVGARIASGDAGDGGTAFGFGNGASGDTLNAKGGSGGEGGDVRIDAGGVLRFSPSAEPLIVLGNGGHGGNADIVVEGTNVTAFSVTGGRGGDGGSPSFAAESVEGLTFDEFTGITIVGVALEEFEVEGGITIWVLTGDSANLMAGGAGGDGGQAGGLNDRIETVMGKDNSFDDRRVSSKNSTVAYQQQATCPPTQGNDANPVVFTGLPGGAGWFEPSRGGDAQALAWDGEATGKGGDATATGGTGGDLRTILPLSLEPIGVPVGLTVAALWTDGGVGGDALAQAGDGGAEGGAGGVAEATGGTGGNAPYPQSFVDLHVAVTSGGQGGSAQAGGGKGRDGIPCCNPPQQGQQGGRGGSATATGGTGGAGWFGGHGGDVEVDGGSGGDGGDGSTPGIGGGLGAAVATPGPPGPGLTAGVAGLTRRRQVGVRGVDGGDCAVACCVSGECVTMTSEEACGSAGGEALGAEKTCEANANECEEPPGPQPDEFRIVEVNFPSTLSNTDKDYGDLAVTWSGTPTFRVTLQFYPAEGFGCPDHEFEGGGFGCVTRTITHEYMNPLVYNNAFRCNIVNPAITEGPVLFTYVVVLTDAEGLQSNKVFVEIVCVP